MAREKVEDIVYKLAEPIADKNSCELVDVEFKKEGPDWFLRIFIDKEEGVTLDDCEIVSRALSDELDRVDPIVQSYYLEVSSPGINRPLKKDSDFERFIGEKIEVRLYRPRDGKKNFIGTLENFKDGIIYLKSDEEDIIQINKADTALVRLSG